MDRRPGFDFGGNGGAYIPNKVIISIRFKAGLAIREAVSRAPILIDYSGMLARPPTESYRFWAFVVRERTAPNGSRSIA